MTYSIYSNLALSYQMQVNWIIIIAAGFDPALSTAIRNTFIYSLICFFFQCTSCESTGFFAHSEARINITRERCAMPSLNKSLKKIVTKTSWRDAYWDTNSFFNIFKQLFLWNYCEKIILSKLFWQLHIYLK